MHINKLLFTILFLGIALVTPSCKKQLDVQNPNKPTAAINVSSLSGLIAIAQGGVYTNGFYNGDVWLGNSYFSLPYGYSELMADVLGADASNNQITTVGQPDYYILDDGTKKTNPSPQIALLRTYNSRSASNNNNNVLYFQWLNMYALNGACNTVLSYMDAVTLSADAAATIKAWCYWWKGYAYASIGSMYFSGLIADSVNAQSNNYVSKDSILAHSNYYLTLTANTLSAIPAGSADYSSVLGQLIPSYFQVGNGGILTTDMWKRNINTLLARNILVNKLSPFVNDDPNAAIIKSSTTTMSTADWSQVLTLATDGIKDGDFVFTGRSAAANSYFSASGGTAASLTTGPNISTTFKISERFMQNFEAGDKRKSTDFYANNNYHNDFFSTRYSMFDSLTQATTGVYSFGSKVAGQYEVFIAGSYEENALMLAEANIRAGNIDAGLAYVDAVRSYQGAGVTPVANTGLSLPLALKQLTKERRIALVFRGISYYDSRRWGWTYDIANGGGSYGNTILTNTDVLSTNATINYNFLDYWDIPADETVLNPPASGSAPVVNPNF